MSVRQQLRAIVKVAKRSFRIAPSAAIVKIFDSVIYAVLPIVTTFFASLTTTALADAYGGVEGAAGDAILYVLLTIVAGIVSMSWRSVSDYISQKTRYVLDAAIEDEMMLQFSRLPFYMYDDKEVMDLHEKAKRFSYFFSGIFESIGMMAGGLFSAIGASIALIYVSPWVALAVIIAIIPGVFLQIKLARQQMKHWQGNITLRRRQGHMGWLLREADVIGEMRVYGVAKHLINTYSELRKTDERGRLEFELRMIWKKLAADIGALLVQLGSLIWVTLQIIDRAQPVGQFLYVQQMVSQAIGSADRLAMQLGRMDEDLANMIEYQSFMELEQIDDVGESLSKSPEVISFDRVSFKYPKTDKFVLKDVSIEVAKGQRVAIVGENGAGKSTIVKLIMGLYSPTTGQVLIDNRPLSEFKLSSWHRQIGLLGQEFALYTFGTIRENITLGDVNKRPTNKRIDEAVKMAEFGGVIKDLRHGIDTYVSRWMADDKDDTTATELSGGQKQRLALARNFFRDSPLVVLDEPTSAIDALAEARVFDRLFKESDKTIVMVSHRLTTIEKADVIYMIENGQVVERGKHEDLVALRGKYFSMFKSQLRVE